MQNQEERWTVEAVAEADLALKRLPNAHEVCMAVDRLFFAQDEKGGIQKLKESGHILVGIKSEMSEELRSQWVSGLGRQLRASVDRAKKSAAKK